MGDELAQGREWKHDQSIDWHLLCDDQHQGIKRLVTDLNTIYKAEPSLHQVDFDWRGFEWLELNDSENSVLSFLRRGKNLDDFTVVVCNFTPVVRHDYRVGVPAGGYYREVFNTDAAVYGGSNVGNNGGTWAYPGDWANRAFHLSLTIPPLGVVFLKPTPG